MRLTAAAGLTDNEHKNTLKEILFVLYEQQNLADKCQGALTYFLFVISTVRFCTSLFQSSD